MPTQQLITRLVVEASGGDHRAVNELLPLVYEELRQLAGAMMRQERPDHTLQPTALVHEAYLKLVDRTRMQWTDRAHFLAVAAQAVRHVLVDHARGHRRSKRGGGRAKLSLDERRAAAPGLPAEEVDLLAVDEALEDLATDDPREARVVEMRFFGGMTIEETAAVLGISAATVERDWRYARARLYKALADHRGPPNREDAGDS
jgi:RNA polymerase sigma factor (TIGR02999 family)